MEEISGRKRQLGGLSEEGVCLREIAEEDRHVGQRFQRRAMALAIEVPGRLQGRPGRGTGAVEVAALPGTGGGRGEHRRQPR